MPHRARSGLACATRTATIAAVAALALLAPRALHADDESTILGTFLQSYRAGDDGIAVNGEVVRDPRAKSGWSVQVSFENRTNARDTVHTVVVLERSMFSPASRVSVSRAELFGRVEAVEVAPYETKVVLLPLPAAIGAEIDQSNALAHAKARAVARANARGDEPPSWAYGWEAQPRRVFNVLLRAPPLS